MGEVRYPRQVAIHASTTHPPHTSIPYDWPASDLKTVNTLIRLDRCSRMRETHTRNAASQACQIYMPVDIDENDNYQGTGDIDH
jgi:hypothetical protein